MALPDATPWCVALAELMRRLVLEPARVVVLLPFAQILPEARRAWARLQPAGFLPRFETTHTWSDRTSAFAPDQNDLAFEPAHDLLTARRLLARAGLARQALAQAPRLLQTALSLAPLAAAASLSARADWAQRADIAVSGGAASSSAWFALETALARVAVAWVGASRYATDVLLAPGVGNDVEALVVIEGVLLDPLTQAVAASFGDRAHRLGLVPAVAAAPVAASLAWHAAMDPEDEAARAAACVMRHLAEQRQPVALIATDRALTRRIGAALAAHDVEMHDATGWRLSTTRAAATLVGALRACAHDASSDTVLDWLKNASRFDDVAVQQLETQLRKHGLRQWSAWCERIARALPIGPAAGAGERSLSSPVLHVLTVTIEQRRAAMTVARSLRDWLAATRHLLESGGQWQQLAEDAAGARVVEDLHLGPDAEPLDAFNEEGTGIGEAQPGLVRLTLAEFSTWVRQVLEAGRFVPPSPEAATPAVHVLPLAQTVGRKFAAVVVPGCDEQRLPAWPELPGNWSAAQRLALGLPSRENAAQAQRSAWAHLVAGSPTDLLWRQTDASGDAVRPSPLLQQLALAGMAISSADPRPLRHVESEPTLHPQPRGDALPLDTLSASAYEDLRRCPYRFFATRLLRLVAADELEATLGKREFGSWLHLLLGHFHQALDAAPEADAGGRLALIDAAADRASRELALSQAEFLPFAAAWPAVRAGYMEWLAEHEAQEGARFAVAESERQQPLGTLRLRGRIDRIDTLPEGRPFVIDYKTEALAATRKRVVDATEDTQLAFYAALLPDDTLRAAYVSVGEPSQTMRRTGRGHSTRTVEQAQVVPARDALIAGVLHDFACIDAGAPMPALGEGAVCEHCDARGLCRKDFWG